MIYSITPIKTFQRLAFCFSTKKAPIFPYIMGGLPTSQYFVNSKAQQFQHMVLTEDIDKTFIELYQKYLSALEAQDLKYLNENVEKKLLSGLTQHFPSVTLLNKDAPVTVAVHSNELIGNVGFDRDFHGSEMKLKKTPSKYEGCFSAFQCFSLDQNRDQGLFRLFSTKVYFKTALKLTKSKKKEGNESEKQSLNEEIHLVQFQAQSKSSKFRLILRKFISKLLNLRNKEKYREEMMRLLWGASPNSVWKIADVDRVLHGNLPKIVTEFSGPNLKHKENKNEKK